MKVVVALAQPPLHEGGAPGRVALGLLRGLQAHGIDVQAIAARQHFAVSGSPPVDLPVEVVDVPAPSRSNGWTRVQQLRRPRGGLARSAFGARVREAAASADVLHLEEADTAWCDEHVATPSLVHLHYRVRRDRSWPAPWRREFRRMLEFELAERAAIRRHRYLVASSAALAAGLRTEKPEGDVVVAPLSLDPAHYSPAPLDGPPRVGLIGTAAWGPTAAAAQRLVERVWPLVRRDAPEATLAIAGRGWARVRGLAGPGVAFEGEVESGAAFMRTLSLLLFPLERGSGVKVKTLEAIASGVPVVTTPAGAEGIDGGDGVVVESSDEALARAAAELLTDAGARRARGQAARARFDGLYAPVPATAPLVDLYRRITR